MKKLFLILSILLLSFPASGKPLSAEEQIIQIQERCRHPNWHKVNQLHNQEARRYLIQENNCLKKYILDEFSILFDDEQSLSSATQQLNTLQQSYLGMYSQVYNHNYSCKKDKDFYNCGDGNIGIAESLWNQALQNILSNLVRYNWILKSEANSARQQSEYFNAPEDI